jgi:ferredoxin--NADP+ reductase
MPSLDNLPQATITERRDITHDLMVIKLQTPQPFIFKAGQYITIGLEDVERPYSIVSSPLEPQVELFVELVPLPDGVLTPKLWKVKAGDLLRYRPRAKGLFTFNPKYTNHLMIATVTGVAPYVSMLRFLVSQGLDSHKFFVLQGASYQDEFTYLDELTALAKQHPNCITYLPTVSRPQEQRNASWKGATGRVNAIAEEWAATWGLDGVKEQTLVYACGHPGMIEDVKARFTPQGWKVQEERFWKED